LFDVCRKNEKKEGARRGGEGDGEGKRKIDREKE